MPSHSRKTAAAVPPVSLAMLVKVVFQTLTFSMRQCMNESVFQVGTSMLHLFLLFLQTIVGNVAIVLFAMMVALISNTKKHRVNNSSPRTKAHAHADTEQKVEIMQGTYMQAGTVCADGRRCIHMDMLTHTYTVYDCSWRDAHARFNGSGSTEDDSVEECMFWPVNARLLAEHKKDQYSESIGNDDWY